MAAESPEGGSSTITAAEVKSKAFRPYMTMFMNAFRNCLFKVVLENDEEEFSSSTTGTLFSLIPPFEEGSKEEFGSCRNNVRYALCSPAVFIGKGKEKFLSGERASKELLSFVKHHQNKVPKTISEESLKEMVFIVNNFCDFLKWGLNGATLEQFRLHIETKFGSDVSLWPKGTDTTHSPLKKGQERKGQEMKRKREEKSELGDKEECPTEAQRRKKNNEKNNEKNEKNNEKNNNDNSRAAGLKSPPP